LIFQQTQFTLTTVVLSLIEGFALKIAIHQMCSGIDIHANAHEIMQNISDAAKHGAKMYFAPEMSGLIDKDRARAASSIGVEQVCDVLKAAQNACKAGGIWAHLGSLPIKLRKEDSLIRNRTFVIDAQGEIRARYDKIHLFDVDLASGESWRESSAYSAGDEAVLVDTPIGLMGLSICYDLRFPQLYSRLRDHGATILAVPAAFTVPTGAAHWHVLLRARAIENACYVIAAAQTGHHADGRTTYGHSLVIDPWGEVALDMGPEAGLAFAELDLTRIEKTRMQIPVHLNQQEIPEPIHYSDAKHVRATQ
jgi:deaminated glutathione amidase